MNKECKTCVYGRSNLELEPCNSCNVDTFSNYKQMTKEDEMIIITGTAKELCIFDESGIAGLLTYYMSNESTLDACRITYRTMTKGLDFVMAHGHYMEISENDYARLKACDYIQD